MVCPITYRATITRSDWTRASPLGVHVKKAAVKTEAPLQTCAAKHDSFSVMLSHTMTPFRFPVSTARTRKTIGQAYRIVHPHLRVKWMTCVVLSGVALVPCGHRRFCASFADTVAAMHSGCLLCCTPIQVVLRLFRETTPVSYTHLTLPTNREV